MSDWPAITESERRRIADIKTLLEFARVRPADKVLDIGIGTGAIAQVLSQRVGRIVGTGLRFASYAVPDELKRNDKIDLVEAIIERLPFQEQSFDVVLMSHVLEHAPNVGLALGETRRVLRSEGLLCVFVPPAEDVVAGGHISVGWNVGQLMYVLAVNGFDTAHGHYARYGYNICAFVQKDNRPLPPLRHDFGDLRTLADAGRFPIPLGQRTDGREAFRGDLEALNWPWTQIFPPPLPLRRRHFVGRALRRLLPLRARQRLARFLTRGVAAMSAETVVSSHSVNPGTLSE